VLHKMGRDKKFEAGKIRFVLLRAAGDAYLGDEVTAADLAEAIGHLRTPRSAA
jgi:3-dehydroquinate synthase